MPQLGLERSRGWRTKRPPAAILKNTALADLTDAYAATRAGADGKTKVPSLTMLKTSLGKLKLTNLSALVLRDFIDNRVEDGAGGQRRLRRGSGTA